MIGLEERLRLRVGRGCMDVFVSRGVWNCREEWVKETFRVATCYRVGGA